jgi:hypothetical protein
MSASIESTSSTSTISTPGSSLTRAIAASETSDATTFAPSSTRWPTNREPTFPSPWTAIFRPSRLSVPNAAWAAAFMPR